MLIQTISNRHLVFSSSVAERSLGKDRSQGPTVHVICFVNGHGWLVSSTDTRISMLIINKSRVAVKLAAVVYWCQSTVGCCRIDPTSCDGISSWMVGHHESLFRSYLRSICDVLAT